MNYCMNNQQFFCSTVKALLYLKKAAYKISHTFLAHNLYYNCFTDINWYSWTYMDGKPINKFRWHYNISKYIINFIDLGEFCRLHIYQYSLSGIFSPCINMWGVSLHKPHTVPIIVHIGIIHVTTSMYSRTSSLGHHEIRDISPTGTFFLCPEFAPLT